MHVQLQRDARLVAAQPVHRRREQECGRGFPLLAVAARGAFACASGRPLAHSFHCLPDDAVRELAQILLDARPCGSGVLWSRLIPQFFDEIEEVFAHERLGAAGHEGVRAEGPRVVEQREVVEQPPQASCLLRVPTLNVRSGPGLEFPVVAKVRGTDEQPGSVVVVGFDASQQWMQVTDRIAPGGWVTSNPDFIICTGDLAALPVQGAPAAQATGTTTDTAAANAAASRRR